MARWLDSLHQAAKSCLPGHILEQLKDATCEPSVVGRCLFFVMAIDAIDAIDVRARSGLFIS